MEGLRPSSLPCSKSRFTVVRNDEVRVAKGWRKQHQFQIKFGSLCRGVGRREAPERRPDEHVEGAVVIDGLEHHAGLRRLVPAVLAHVERQDLPALLAHPVDFAAVG